MTRPMSVLSSCHVDIFTSVSLFGDNALHRWGGIAQAHLWVVTGQCNAGCKWLTFSNPSKNLELLTVLWYLGPCHRCSWAAGLRFEWKLPAASEIDTGDFHGRRCSTEVKYHKSNKDASLQGHLETTDRDAARGLLLEKGHSGSGSLSSSTSELFRWLCCGSFDCEWNLGSESWKQQLRAVIGQGSDLDQHHGQLHHKENSFREEKRVFI